MTHPDIQQMEESLREARALAAAHCWACDASGEPCEFCNGSGVILPPRLFPDAVVATLGLGALLIRDYLEGSTQTEALRVARHCVHLYMESSVEGMVRAGMAGPEAWKVVVENIEKSPTRAGASGEYAKLFSDLMRKCPVGVLKTEDELRAWWRRKISEL